MKRPQNVDWDFRIFIDAATLKVIYDPIATRQEKDFRIFIDAATLKVASCTCEDTRARQFPHLYRCGHIEGHYGDATAFFLKKFPHLYRCGHIEGRIAIRRGIRRNRDFRIFIDAATLKESSLSQMALLL